MNIPIIPPFSRPPHTATASVRTRFSICFEVLLTAFAEFVGAEVDLDFISHNDDPSVSLWKRDRDVAEARLTKGLTHLCKLLVRHPDDRSLHRFAIVLERMLDVNDASYPRQLCREMKVTFATQYQVSSYGPRAYHRNAMLAQAWQLTNAMVKLSRFDFCPERAIEKPVIDDPDAFPTLDF